MVNLRGFVGLFLVSSAFGLVEKDLGGSDWRVENANGSLNIAATVPGQIHLDLL